MPFPIASIDRYLVECHPKSRQYPKALSLEEIGTLGMRLAVRHACQLCCDRRSRKATRITNNWVREMARRREGIRRNEVLYINIYETVRCCGGGI